MKFFSKGPGATLVFGAAMLALVGTDSVSAEQVDAANQELDAAGIKGAQLVPGATLDELTAAAERTEAAEKTASEATEKATGLQSKLDEATARIAELEAQPGATHTRPSKGTKSDVEEGDVNADQKLVMELHEKMLSGS